MNTAQLLDDISANGGQLFLVNDRLKYRLPKLLADKVLPDLKAHKAEILDFLKSKERHSQQRSKAAVYRVIVDGKGMTVIDPHRLSFDEMEAQLFARFGADRVHSIVRR